MATTSVAQPGTGPTSRVERGQDLYRLCGSEIIDAGEGVYFVPSSSRRGCFHKVTLTDVEESCTCEDFEFYSSKHGCLCFHGYAAAIKRAHQEAAERRKTRAKGHRTRHQDNPLWGAADSKQLDKVAQRIGV
jgi:hypothetical protein